MRLDKFKIRPYQRDFVDAFENKKFRKLVVIWPRRSGKDLVAWNLLIREALRKVGVYFMIYPTYSQGKKILWSSITNSGVRYLDYIPPELIVSTNAQEMKIILLNGSSIQVLGSENPDSIVGTNPMGVVYSEFAIQDPRIYQLLRPVQAANDGWAIFISTPRGKNHFYDLWKIAQDNSHSWFSQRLTLDETKHIPMSEIDKDRSEGVMSEDLIQQEYYCSFTMGVEGAFYTKYLDNMRTSNQITLVPWESAFKVNTAWDIGMRDSTAIIFFQNIGGTVRIIDCYEKSKEGMEHYIKLVHSKPYLYGTHIGPHDIAVTEYGSGMSRIQKAQNLGLHFTLATNMGVMDGIEAVRSSLSKVYMDTNKCGPLIKALENYRQEYDNKHKIYKSTPLHDNHSHFADAMRYLCVSLPKTQDGLTPSAIDKIKNEAIYGGKPSGDSFFNEKTYY